MLTKKEIEIEIELQIGIEIKAEIMKTGLEIRENIKTTPLIMISKEKSHTPPLATQIKQLELYDKSLLSRRSLEIQISWGNYKTIAATIHFC